MKRGFLGINEDDLSEREHQYLVLMARNYALIECLHGHVTILPGRMEKLKTIGDCVAAAFADHVERMKQESE